MELDNKKEIKKQIRRAQVNKAYHEKQAAYCDDEIKILNNALQDLKEK